MKAPKSPFAYTDMDTIYLVYKNTDDLYPSPPHKDYILLNTKNGNILEFDKSDLEDLLDELVGQEEKIYENFAIVETGNIRGMKNR